jgi:HK97 family phage major capsid protein
MNIQEINTKLDNLTSGWAQFALESKSPKIEQLEHKVNSMQSAFLRPESVNFSPMEDKSFSNYLRKGDISGLETKSLSASVNEDGGFLIAPSMYDKIITGLRAKSVMRRLASIETISTTALDIILEGDGEFKAGWVTDTAERAVTDNPKLEHKRIMVHELYAQPKATQRLLDDSAINVEAWVTERLQDSFLATENHSFFNGDGNNKPHGILQYDADHIERVAAQEAGKVSPIDLLHLINSLDEDYLSNPSMIMHRTTLSQIQSLRDGNGRFIWQPAISEAQPETLFGIPILCSSDMPTFGEGSLAIALGDFKKGYKIVDRSGISMMRDPYTEKPFVKFYAVKRVGGDVINSDAIKFLKV